MKMFNKVLAVILSLVMLLSVVPVAVFASSNGNDQPTNIDDVVVEAGSSDVPAGYGEHAGTGASGTITLNLDANALVAAIKGEKSKAALLELIQDAIDRSKTDVLTKNDLLALIPKQQLAEAIANTTDKATVVAVLSEMFKAMSEDARNEIVYEVSNVRDEDAMSKLSSTIFYTIYNETGDSEKAMETMTELSNVLAELLNEKLGSEDFDEYFSDGNGGYDFEKLIKEFYLPAVCSVIGYREYLTGDAFAEFVDLEKLTKPATIVDIIEEIGVVNTLKALKVLAENADELLNKEQAKAVAAVLYTATSANIDLIAINGYAVVHNDGGYTKAYLDAGEITRAIKSLVPRLTEWAECEDGNIFSFNLVAEYQDANNSANYIKKDINVQIVLEEGDLAVFRSFAKTLAQYITVYNKGTDLYIEVTLPGVITRALASYLENCTEGEEIKDEFLELAGKNAAELVAALENMTWDRIIAVFASIDVEKLYTYVTSLSQVEYVLELVQNKLGLNYKLEDIQDLNKIIHKLASEEGQAVLNKATLENIVEVLSNYIKVDIMAYLNKTTAIIDKTETVEILLAQLKAMPLIGDYVAAKIQSDSFSLTEFVEEYKNLGAADAMAAFVTKAFQKDFWAYIENNTANEIYDRIIAEVEERASTFGFIFNTIKNTALFAAGLVQTYAPDELNLGEKAFGNTYRGNGAFELLDLNFSDLDLGTGTTNLLAKLLAKLGLNPDYVDYLDLIMPMDQLDNLDFGIHLTLNVPNISKVIYLKEDRTEDTVMFMPNGLNPGRFHGVDEGVSYWIDDATDAIVTKVTGDVTLYPVSGLFTGGYLTVNGNNWTITSKSEDFKIIVNVSEKDFRDQIAALDSLTFANIYGLKITMNKAVLADVLAKTEGYFTVSYDFTTDCDKVESANGGYSFTPARVESFNLSLDGAAFEGNFAEAVDVTIPFAKALAYKEKLQQTNVYNVVDGKLTAEALSVTATAGKNVVLHAMHFSDYTVVNEYWYETKFYENDLSTPLTGDGNADGSKVQGFVPAGATVTVVPQTEYRPGKLILSILYNGTKVNLGAKMTMPAAPVTVKCVVELIEGSVVYSIFGNPIVNDADAAVAALADAIAAGKVPAGYTVLDNNAWVNNSAANATVYVLPVLTAIEFEATFPNGVKQTFTVENLSDDLFPAVEAKAGYIGAWTTEDGKTFAELIASIDNKTAVTEAVKFNAVADDDAKAMIFVVTLPDGTTVEKPCGETYAYPDVEAGKAAKYFIVSSDANNGKEIALENGVFTMPAYDVIVVIGNKVVTYTINGEEFNAELGSFDSFEVELAKGATFATKPNEASVSSVIINKNGGKTYTYTFEVKENLAITYAINANAIATVQLVNGMTGNDTATDIKDLSFAGYSKLALDGANYEFALYEVEDVKASLVWLWILIALIVLIALIALLYRLYITEKLKPNFLLRGVTWIVSMFFNACLAVSGAALYVLQGTTKKGQVDYAEFGMKNPEELEATETATETAAEEATEAAEGDDAVAAFETVEAEEVAVDEAVEATEEITETAAEEVTEVVEETAEATEEAVEETAEATEAVAEEAAEDQQN